MKPSFFSTRLIGIAVAAACLAGTAGITQAATANTNMTVSTSIPVSCSFGTVTNVTIPSPATLNVAADSTATGTVQVTCTDKSTYTLNADNGSNYDSTNATRRMRKGSTGSVYLTYGLFTDSARTTAFPTATQTANGSTQTITIYAKLNAQTATEAGAYTDTVQLTVTY